MPSDWQTETVESLIESGAIVGHKDGNYGSLYPRAEEFGTEGVPFVTAKSIANGVLDIDNAPRLSDDRAAALTFGFVEPDDVLLSHNATVGRVAVVQHFTGRLLVGTSLTYFRLNRKRLLPRYFASYLSGTGFQNQLAAVMSHSTRNQVPITAQRKLKIVVPPLSDQERIAHILGTLDDKIELNRRMNATLEAMARALFQSWFVDFDPVRAKAAGQPPAGIDPATADLFPASFETATVGKVPRGWRVRYLLELCDFEYGKPLKESDRAGGQVPVYGSNGIVGWHDQSLVEGPGIVVGRKGTAGTVTWAATDFFPIDTTFWIRPKSDAPPLSFLFLQLETMELSRLTADSAVPGLNRNAAYSQLVVSPTLAVLKQFENVVMPLFSLIHRNALETRTLSQLRDTLLPELLQGRLTAAVK